MTARLLLDEHYSGEIAERLHDRGHDVAAVVSTSDLRGASDAQVYQWAAQNGRRIVTENVKDFRPLLMLGTASGSPLAPLLLVPPRRFPRGHGNRTAMIVGALHDWLSRRDADHRSLEDWLV